MLGGAAAAAYAQWHSWPFAFLGLLLSTSWLIADGLDGMVARATGTSSPFGRTLDGLVDHGVFVLIYVTLALTIGTFEGWAWAVSAGVAHAVQSSLYEGERSRFHRRAKGIAATTPAKLSHNPFVRLYDSVATSLDRAGIRFERALANADDPQEMGRAYADAATPALRFMSLLTANVRVLAIFVACLAGNPRIFWGFEIVPLTVVAVIGIVWHRRVERAFVRGRSSLAAEDRTAPIFIVKEQGH